MKVFVAVLVAALLAAASAQYYIPINANCPRGLAVDDPPMYTDAENRFHDCQTACGGVSSLTQNDPTTTSDPIVLLTAPTDANGNVDVAQISRSAGTAPFTTAAQTQFRNDHVLIYFSESVRYYGKPFGDSISSENPDVRFGTNPQIASNNDYTALFDKVAYQYAGSSAASCSNVVEMDLVWGKFLSTYSDSNIPPNPLDGAYTRTQDSSTKVITYTIDFSVVNYEYIVISRPNSVDIPLERTLQHSVPFKITFVTQASITSSSITVYSQIYALAAIVSQSVTVDLTASQAQAVINLYTSIQNPFVIDELRVVSGSAGPTGDTTDDVVASTSSTYTSTPFNVYVDSNTGTTIRTATVDDQGVASQNGDGVTNKHFVAARANEAGSCDGSGSVCSQIWPIRLGADISQNVCNFDGSYVVTFTIRCRSSVADADCPINRNPTYNNARIAVGSVNDVTGINQEQFTLTLASSNHCPTVIDTIGLSAKLTIHGEPLSITGNLASFAATTLTSTTPYVNLADSTTVDALSTAGIPNGNYGTSGNAPVNSDNDPDTVAWGPDAPDASFSVLSLTDGKVAFLNGQWVFGVAAVQVQQATVIRSSITSLNVAGITSGVTNNIVTNGLWDTSAQHPWTDALQSKLLFTFVDDVTTVNINNAAKIAYPYFYFKVDQGALNIAGDASKTITFAGTVTVTYQNAPPSSSAFGAEELSSVDIPFKFSLSTASPASLKNTGSSISATIGVGNSASTGTASAGNSTFLGVSSSTAAGVALAVGVVVGLLVGLLVAAARRPAAPTKSASQVQLTSAAATSAV